jgi:hypothetical protein
VRVVPACAESGEGSDHFGSYVNISNNNRLNLTVSKNCHIIIHFVSILVFRNVTRSEYF